SRSFPCTCRTPPRTAPAGCPIACSVPVLRSQLRSPGPSSDFSSSWFLLFTWNVESQPAVDHRQVGRSPDHRCIEIRAEGIFRRNDLALLQRAREILATYIEFPWPNDMRDLRMQGGKGR